MKSHNIKDILEERRMEVSENSWEQLSAKLDANDERKKRRSLYPYAACIALLVSLIAFVVGKNVGESQIVVDTDETIQIQEEIEVPKPVIFNETINEEIFKESVAENKETIQPKPIAVKKEQLKQKHQVETAIAFQKEIKNTVAIQEKENSFKEVKTIITQKEVVIDENKDLKASIIALSAAEKIAITDAEINQLLKEAEESLSELDIKEEDVLRFATADELLDEVELELDRSFKKKVFELVKHKISKTRTAAIDR